MEIKLGEILKFLKLETLDSKHKLIALFIIICGGILTVILKKPKNKIDLNVKVKKADIKEGASVGVVDEINGKVKMKVNAKSAKIEGGAKVGIVKRK